MLTYDYAINISIIHCVIKLFFKFAFISIFEYYSLHKYQISPNSDLCLYFNLSLFHLNFLLFNVSMHFDETLYLELLYHILKSLIIELYHIIHIVSQNELFTFPFYSEISIISKSPIFPQCQYSTYFRRLRFLFCP